MNRLTALTIACASCLALTLSAAERYVSLDGGHIPPFLTWADASTNIQDAIDVSEAGDVVLVTNGVYATGGKVMAGDLTNRVALDKAVTVRSINGPAVTEIRGSLGENGNGAIRCAWLTNGATLAGFTLQGGRTRTTSEAELRNGGGAFCLTNGVLANCILSNNMCWGEGAGMFQGQAYNCALIANTGNNYGGGAASAVLNHCTVISNSAAAVRGIFRSTATNCIIFYNERYGSSENHDRANSTIAYSCTTPLPPSGIGNISAPPQVIWPSLRLGVASPCRGTGLAITGAGTDLYGRPWADLPSMGCVEWDPAPLAVSPPVLRLSTNSVGFTVTAQVQGGEPLTFAWLRDGVPITNDSGISGADAPTLVVSGLALADMAGYQLVASNAWAMVTTAVVRLTGRYVDAASTSPTAPFNSWQTAATNIQDAIDAASAGEVVWVTNGLYASGGRAMIGTLTNRVAINKAVVVRSVNGPEQTTIRGAWVVPGTNGPGAVRCVALTNGAVLSGFTLSGGATEVSGQTSGGGVFGSSTNTLVENCIIENNSGILGGGAGFTRLANCTLRFNVANGPGGSYGGGAYHCQLSNCLLSENSAGTGGGAHGGNLVNCRLTGNTAGNGGGAAQSGLANCALVTNSAAYAGGAEYCTLTSSTVSRNVSAYTAALDHSSTLNSVVYGNYSISAITNQNFSSSTFAFSCTTPLPGGEGNISADPGLLDDAIHLASDSPCRRAGTNYSLTGTDIDGQPWGANPSIGCDEWYAEPLVVRAPASLVSGTPPSLRVVGLVVAGQEPFTFLWRKDGTDLQDDAHYRGTRTSELEMSALGPSDAGVYTAVIKNAAGQVTTANLRVTIHCVDAAGASPESPYGSWQTAATVVQDAIDAAEPYAIILLTNGVYASGGRAEPGLLTNRMVLRKPPGWCEWRRAYRRSRLGAGRRSSRNPMRLDGRWLQVGRVDPNRRSDPGLRLHGRHLRRRRGVQRDQLRAFGVRGQQ